MKRKISIMLNSERRREYLLAQALTYLTVGLFLISYSNDTDMAEFIFFSGIFLCALSFIYYFIVTFLNKCIKHMEVIDTYAKIAILPLTFIALFMNAIESADKAYFVLRFWITFIWIIIAVFSMIVAFVRIAKLSISTTLGMKGFLHKIFVVIEFFTIGLGVYLLIMEVIAPNTIKTLTEINEWAYNPYVYFLIAALCVVPMLICAPTDSDNP